MNRFIKHILFFGGLLFFTYVIFILLWGSFLPTGLKSNLVFKQSGGHLYSRIQELPNYKDIDLLFLGSSHAYRGFDTRIFQQHGFSSFNLGSSSQTPVQTLVLLRKYLDNIKPKCIVFEICPQVLSSDGVESALDIISNDKIDWFSTNMVFEVHNLKLYNTFIYSAMRQLFQLDNGFVENRVIGKDTYIAGGYVQRQEQGYITQQSKEKYVIKQDQLEAFEAVVKLIKSKDIELVLVQAPVSTLEYTRFDNHTSFDSSMSLHSNYYNFNTILNLEDSVYFYDSHHLNHKGVKQFNESLIKVLFN